MSVEFSLRMKVGDEWAAVPFCISPSVVEDDENAALSVVREAYRELLRFAAQEKAA